MKKILLGNGSQGSGDSAFVGGGKLNDNFIELVQLLAGETIWSGNNDQTIALALNTTNKTSLIGALNEVLERTKLVDNSLDASVFKTWSIDKMKQEFSSASLIDDLLTSSSSNTWSIDRLKVEFVDHSELDTAVANLVDSSPAALDTLNELATALGNDPNFATTMTNLIATKADATALDNVAYNNINNNFNANQDFLGNIVVGNNTNQHIRFSTSAVWNYYLQSDGNNWHIDDGQGDKFIELKYNSGGATKSIEFAQLANFASNVTAPLFEVSTATGWMVKHNSGNHGLSYDSTTGRTQLQSSGSIPLEFQGTTVYSRNLIVNGLSTISSTLGVTGEITASGGVKLPDSKKINIGTGSDLQIYHDGSDTYFQGINGNVYHFISNSSSHIWHTNGLERFRIKADGVGSFAKLFEANGGVSFGSHARFDNATEIRWKDSEETERTAMQLNSSNDLYIGGSFAGSTIFVGGGSYTERFRISDTGVIEYSTDIVASGQTVTANHFILPDNGEIRFGAENDMQVKHDGSHGYFDLDTGNLYMRESATTRFSFIMSTGELQATNFVGSWNGVSDLSDYVTINTSQTISGVKTFTSTLALVDNFQFYESSGSNKFGRFYFDETNQQVRLIQRDTGANRNADLYLYESGAYRKAATEYYVTQQGYLTTASAAINYVRKNVLEAQNFYNITNGTALLFAYADSNNADYISYNDSTNAFYFNADSDINNTSGSAGIYAGNIYLSGNLVATQAWVNSQNFLTSIGSEYVRNNVVTTFTKAQGFGEKTATYSATLAWDLDNNQCMGVTLTGNTTLANPSNKKSGFYYTLRVTQDGTGGRTLSFSSNYKFGDAGTPSIDTGANKVSILTFYCDGTDMLFTGMNKGF